MPGIILTLNAETPEELRALIGGLADLVDAVEGDEGAVTARTVLNDIKAEAGAQPTEPPTEKRGRGRPKKQPAPVVEEAPKVEPPLAPPTPEELKDAAPVATIAPLPPTEPAVSEPVPGPTFTIDDVRNELKVLVNAKGGDAARAVLREQGYEKLSDLPPQMYGEIIAKAKAAAQ